MGRHKKPIKETHVVRALHGAKYRSKRDNVPFNLTKEYLMSIATDECPVFHTPFEWGVSGLGEGMGKPNGPTLDRVLPELGYVVGNVAFLSQRANRIKDNGTMQEHYDIADWIWNHIHAKENTAAPVSTGDYIQGELYPELGFVSTPWTRQDDDNTDHNSGTVSRQDVDHRAQTGSGDSMGHGGQEVGTPETPESQQNNGKPPNPAIWP